MQDEAPTRSVWLGPEAELPARRLVSLVPSLTLAVFELGAGARLAGRTRFCVEPSPEVERVPVVGGTKNVHVNEVLALAPDLVLANREENVRARVEALARHVAVWVSDPRGPQDVAPLWRELGAIAGAPAHAERRANAVRSVLADVERASSQATPAFVYWVWRDPWMAAGHDTYISRLLTAAGWRNAVPEAMRRYPRLAPRRALALGAAAMLFPDEPYAFALPGDLDAFGGAVESPKGWLLPGGAVALRASGRELGWYPSYTVSGLERAAAFRTVAGG